MKIIRPAILLLLSLLANQAMAQPRVVSLLVNGLYGDSVELAVIDPRSGEKVASRILESGLNATLSRDKQRLYVLAIRNHPFQPFIETYATESLELLSSVDIPYLGGGIGFETVMVEHPQQPGVLMFSRCWWVDTQTGTVMVINEPGAFTYPCDGFLQGDGLSPSGRYMLVTRREPLPPDVSPVTLVALDDPHTTILELEGPSVIVDDEQVAVQAEQRIELRAIADGSVRASIALPEHWNSPQLLGSDAGWIYLSHIDTPGPARFAISRISISSGEMEAFTPRFDRRPGSVEFSNGWMLALLQTHAICFLSCQYESSQFSLIHLNTKTTLSKKWPEAGLYSQGLSLGNGPPIALAPISATRPLTLSLLAFILAATAWYALRRTEN